ncbi:MAG: 2-dehydro-3-deoxyphosphooctonate aldolase synthase, partial [bacterium]
MTLPAAVEIAPGVAPGDGRLTLIAGPWLLESRELALTVATRLRDLCAELDVPLVFKGSFDKANRTSASSFRSIGMQPSLEILAEVRETLGLPVTTDVHDAGQVEAVAAVVDVLQIPAFLCRQTDLVIAAAKAVQQAGSWLHVKKGQFLAPGDMRYAVDKVRAGGGERVLLTERGTTFGYHDLVVDYRGLSAMRAFAPVIFDATHSVQS